MYDDKNTVLLLETFNYISEIFTSAIFMISFNIRKESEKNTIELIKKNYNYKYVN